MHHQKSWVGHLAGPCEVGGGGGRGSRALLSLGGCGGVLPRDGLAPPVKVLGLAPVLVNEVKFREGWVVVVTVWVEGKVVLMVVVRAADWGRGTLSLTSVGPKGALLASIVVVVVVLVVAGVAVKVAVEVAVDVAVEVAVEVAAVRVIVGVSMSSSVSDRLSSCSRVYGERESSSSSFCWNSSSCRMSSSQSKLSSELSSEVSGASCLITGGIVAVGRVSVGVVCGGKVKRPFVPK